MQDWTYGQGPHIFTVAVRSLPVFIFATRIFKLSTAGAVHVLRTEQFFCLSSLPTRKQTLWGPARDTYVVLRRKPKSLQFAVNFPAISSAQIVYLWPTPPSFMASCLPHANRGSFEVCPGQPLVGQGLHCSSNSLRRLTRYLFQRWCSFRTSCSSLILLGPTNLLLQISRLRRRPIFVRLS